VGDFKLITTAVYEGSTRPLAGLKLGREYRFRIDSRGMAAQKMPPPFAAWRPKWEDAFLIRWSDVVNLEIQDASRTEIKTRVEQRASGGIWSPMGTRAPVGNTQSKFLAQSYVAITTPDGDYLFRIKEEAQKLEGRLLQTRHLRPTPAAPTPVEDSSSDPLRQLEKLGQLRDAGVLTREEFDAKKAEILSRI
jgi:hypothetical protein